MAGIMLCISKNQCSAQQNGTTTLAPFQGTKEFCSFLKPVKFMVTITGSKVKIIYTNNESSDTTNGVFKNGKLYTDDSNEKTYHVQGKYYLLTKSYLRINNLEGGDYD